MYVEQITSQVSTIPAFYIEYKGYAALIDPMPEIEFYQHLIRHRSTRLLYVFETRSRNEFSGNHNALAHATGAHIIYRPFTKRQVLEDVIARDGQEFKLGEARIRLLHTPWITRERSAMRITNEGSNGMAVFAGDTLFLNYVHLSQSLTEEDKLNIQQIEMLRSA